MSVTMTLSARSLNDKIAHLPGVKVRLKREADKIAAKASAVLAANRSSGDSQITVTHGTLDYFVNLDDSRGQHAAAAIEFGHIAPDGTFVEGIHALTGSL